MLIENQLRLGFASNEPRSQYLLEELRRQADTVVAASFEDIDIFTKVAARVLSFQPRRIDWYRNYQMQPLVQRRRKKVLRERLSAARGGLNALLMWGSWFNPELVGESGPLPFFNYIDESLSVTPVLGQTTFSSLGRIKAHRLQAETYRDSQGILCMSHWAREQTLLAHDVSPAKVQVVGWGPCAVDLSREDFRSYAREKIVLHVSSDFYRKGVDFLAAAALEVQRIDPSIKFVVVGEDQSGLRCDYPSNVQRLGRISERKRLEDLFRRASVFLLPHRFDRSPHVLAEAMSAGMPLITSRQGGPVELVEGTGTGFCAPVGDIHGYVRAILTVFENPALAREMGGRAHQLMREEYNWAVVARSILQIVASEPCDSENREHEMVETRVAKSEA